MNSGQMNLGPMIVDRRGASLLVLDVALLAMVLAAALWVPWHPVPGGPVTDVRADSLFSADQVARAEQFSSWARVWSWSGLVVSLAVSVSLAHHRVRGAVSHLPGPWWVKVVLAVVVVTLVGRIATLPFSVGARVNVRRYGLSDQSWSGFARDQAVALGVTWVVVSLVALVVVGSARRWTQGWPLVVAVVLAGLVVVGSFVFPVVVEPLFNRFTPLPDSSLRTAVLDLADREGVPVSDVLVADASRRTTTLNAYVSGFGGTRRVVLYDNLVEDLPQDQALSVVAHELAHAKHRDVVVGTVLGGLGAMVGIGLLGLLWSVARFRLPEPGSPVAVPVLLALVAVASVLAAPVQNLVSRQIETRADVDAVEATGDLSAFVDMQKELALRSLSDPTPPAWSQFCFGSHPTVLRRVAIAKRVAD